jgi:NACHT domain
MARIDLWTDIIAKDLAAFEDPGTEASFEVEGNMIRAVWQVQGTPRDAMFTLRAGERLRWASGDSEDAPYYSFLASEQLAAFPQMARSCVANIKQTSDFVPSEALLESGQETRGVLLTPQELSELVGVAREQAEEGTSTQLLFLKGDAGAGKTTLLRETTRLQAEKYLAGESEFLFLYVPAQGRELSNLRDAIAGELGDLRAVFSYEAVPSLARQGVLVPVIDGFDELLGTAGYSGAFSSLQILLSELESYGTLVVSARSAFYDVEFGRASGTRTDAAMSISTAEIRPWSDPQLERYLTSPRPGRDPERTASALAKLSPPDRELLRRPFFASQFEEFVARTQDDGESHLLDHLIDAYIEREAGKIRDAHGAPVLDANGHRYLFELAVVEMWESGIRQLREDDLKTIALLVAEVFDLDPGQALQLETKVTSYAGFRPRRGARRSISTFAFEHEVYFDHFLGCAIGRMIGESRFEELTHVLDSGVISEAVATTAIGRLSHIATLDQAMLSCPAGVSFENRRRNLATLALAFARELAPLQDRTIRGLSFWDLTSGPARMQRVCLESCQFVDVDLRGAVFDKCEAHDSDFDGITLDDSSRLDIAGLEPGINIKRVHHDPPGHVYAPSAIASLIVRLGAPAPAQPAEEQPYSQHALKLIALLERIAYAYQRATFIYKADERRHQAILSSPDWPELRKLLLDHGVIGEVEREAKGANVAAYQLKANPDELLGGDLQGAASSTSGLWRALRKL